MYSESFKNSIKLLTSSVFVMLQIFYYSKRTQRALQGQSNELQGHSKGTRRHLGTRAMERHLGTPAQKVLGHFGHSGS